MVAMARTGSGKTAAFLVPLFEKLKTHSAKVGVAPPPSIHISVYILYGSTAILFSRDLHTVW